MYFSSLTILTLFFFLIYISISSLLYTLFLDGFSLIMIFFVLSFLPFLILTLPHLSSHFLVFSAHFFSLDMSLLFPFCFIVFITFHWLVSAWLFFFFCCSFLLYRSSQFLILSHPFSHFHVSSSHVFYPCLIPPLIFSSRLSSHLFSLECLWTLRQFEVLEAGLICQIVWQNDGGNNPWSDSSVKVM